MSRDGMELLGAACGQAITDTFLLGRWLFGLGARERERKRLAAQALADERASREQQRQWLDEARRAKTRGDARFATMEEAAAALNGKGGRQSKLDERKFR